MSFQVPIPGSSSVPPPLFDGLPARPARRFRERSEPLSAHEDEFDHLHLSAEYAAQVAKTIADHDIVTLSTVGIDIGSSTSHLLFARITLQREAEALSNRFAVVAREIVWRSPITFTPFLSDGPIDARRLEAFIRDCYAQANLTTGDIDCGAVILTGEAIKRENARAIDELFASEAGKFVCATAGHQLEAMLAAHGSGAVRLSRERDICLLHVDIGGGTTKLALIDRGRIVSLCAFSVGGRLLARDESGTWSRIDDPAKRVGADLGLALDAATIADPAVRDAVAARLAHVALDYITGTARDALGQALLLTNDLDRSLTPEAVSFSGGVAEYLFGRETADFGDIAQRLAAHVRSELRRRVSVPAIDPGVGIRATVIGASQFTVQVSGSTIYLSKAAALPLRNIPVVTLPLPDPLTPDAVAAAIDAALLRNDRERGTPIALAVAWDRSPAYANLLAFCKGIAAGIGVQHTAPLVVLVDGDIAKSIGHLLYDELGWTSPLVSIDGVRLQDLDFVDVGEMVQPAGVIPLVIKSLVFH
jgi:ethanolamine utilization protein EutA